MCAQVKGGPGDGVAYEGATVLDAKQVLMVSMCIYGLLHGVAVINCQVHTA